jgi:hypothetical protein
MEDRRGMMSDDDNEWLALWPGVFGTFDLPEPGEPTICFVVSADYRKISDRLYVLQHLAGDTWMNCHGGAVFEMGDREVIPLSGVSRAPMNFQLQVWNGA